MVEIGYKTDRKEKALRALGLGYVWRLHINGEEAFCDAICAIARTRSLSAAANALFNDCHVVGIEFSDAYYPIRPSDPKDINGTFAADTMRERAPPRIKGRKIDLSSANARLASRTCNAAPASVDVF